MRLSKEARVRFVKMTTTMVVLGILVTGVARNSAKGDEKQLCTGMKLYGVCLCAVKDNTDVVGFPRIITPPGELLHECPTHELGFCTCIDPHDVEFGIHKGDDSRRAGAESKRQPVAKKKNAKSGQSARAKNAERRRQRQRRQERKKARLLDEIEMALDLEEFELADELMDELEELGDCRDDREPDSFRWPWQPKKPRPEPESPRTDSRI